MTALSEKTFAEVPHDDGRGIREWVLRGPAGAVNFLLHEPDGTGLVIGIHAPAAPGDPGARPCDLLDGGACVPDQAYRAAGELGERLARRRDETVIRAGLEDWYASHLAGREAAT
jgi:hypothetical protein